MDDGLDLSGTPADAGKLREAEARLRLAIQAASIGIWEFEVPTGKLLWDQRVREVVESDPDTDPTWEAHFLPTIHPDDADHVQSAFKETVTGGKDLSVAFRVVGQRSGKITWASLVGRKDEGPNGVRILGTARDITAEREGARLIRDRSLVLEERVAQVMAERQIWADIVEASSDPVAAVNTNLTLVALNQAYIDACRRLFDVRFNIGDNLVTELAHLPDAQKATESLWRRALSGRTFEINASGEAGPHGRFYDIKFAPLRGANGTIVGAFQTSRDVTGRVVAERSLKVSEEALQRAQKMEAIGNLTGGVAHDFNNLLQVISGNLQLLGRTVSGNDRAERFLTNAQEGATRAAKLAAQLLAFGRRQALDPKTVNIGRVIVGMDELLRRALGEETEVETSVSGGLWNCFIDPNQVENALLNLAINGRDAMNSTGKLTIEVANASLDETYCRAHPEAKVGQYVMLAVTDTGCGMDAHMMERVFEPFFTTKPEGHGTGLGLSMVYGFVKQSEGHIKIYSELGYGTTIKLYLPRAMGAENARTVSTTLEAPHGSATVLVVEDDEQVRETACALLTDLGYRVLRANDAAGALAVVESGAAIDMIFTDVVMPGPVRSLELARQARERLPGVAILYTSGYTRNAVVHGGRLDPGVELLPKPYTREALALKVADVLAQSRLNVKR